MSLLYVRNKPTRSLVLRPPANASSMCLVLNTHDSHCSANFAYSDTINWTGYVPLTKKPCYGSLGLVQVQNDFFIGIVTECVKLGTVESSIVYRLAKVAFFSVLSDSFDYATDTAADDSVHPCQNLINLLVSSFFYFSLDLDLTRTTQKRYTDQSLGYSKNSLFDRIDSLFVWNKYMVSSLLQIREQELEQQEQQELDNAGIIIIALQGYVGIFERTRIGGDVSGTLCVLSRLSSKRAGTRFNARGIDDDGYVSNFVETETIFYSKKQTFSFLQIRGSVPLFWEQTGLQVTHKIDIMRGIETTLPAIQKHFENLVDRYEIVHIINLLKQSGEGTASESNLGEMYKRIVHSIDEFVGFVYYTGFDFHKIIGRDNYERLRMLTEHLRDSSDAYSFFLSDDDKVVFKQQGIYRTNCVDCLDRTNVVQTIIASTTLKTFFKTHLNITPTEQFNAILNNLWADNGDWLSKIYAGTGALKSSFTRKGRTTLAGFLDDAAKSVNRLYNNKFNDKFRQEAIHILLGTSLNSSTLLFKNPLHEIVMAELHSRESEYSLYDHISIFIGTYNVNGKFPGVRDSLRDWFCECKKPALVVIGVQELIQLSAGQIVKTDAEKCRIIWEGILLNNLNSSIQDSTYVVVRSFNLLALGMFIFVRVEDACNIKNLEISIIKTGMGGMAGNKGGIGVSLSFHDTSMCFITAHLASGTSNYEDRNRDYFTISNGLNFRGKRIQDHERVFWFGDFNYRVNMANEDVRRMIRDGNLEGLLRRDQLNEQKNLGYIFKGFEEGYITFPPTYKYDTGTDRYDTSEKQRIPSWTDRILFKGANLELQNYKRAEINISDHKPVRALFRTKISIINHQLKKTIQKQIYMANSGKTVGMYEPLTIPKRPVQECWYDRKSSNSVLIDLEESGDDPNPFFVDPFSKIHPNPIDEFDPFASIEDTPYNDKYQWSIPTPWWNTPIDLAWIPKEGNGVNPFSSEISRRPEKSMVYVGRKADEVNPFISDTSARVEVKRTFSHEKTEKIMFKNEKSGLLVDVEQKADEANSFISDTGTRVEVKRTFSPEMMEKIMFKNEGKDLLVDIGEERKDGEKRVGKLDPSRFAQFS